MVAFGEEGVKKRAELEPIHNEFIQVKVFFEPTINKIVIKSLFLIMLDNGTFLSHYEWACED